MPYRRTEDSDGDANADAWIAWAFHVDHVVTVAAERAANRAIELALSLEGVSGPGQ